MRGPFDESLPLEALERIDARCSAFEAAWRRGDDPSIADALGDVQGDERASLLLELLLLDLEYRRLRGETPAAEDYRARLPGDAALLDAVLAFEDVFSGPHRTMDKGTLEPRPAPETPGCALPALSEPCVTVASAGWKLGDYTILRQLGRGGMGVVYEAVQESLGRRVALKVLPFDLLSEPRRLERFQLEARAAAALQHPHIVPVYGSGEHEGTHFFTMQFIEGRGLDQVIEEKKAARARDSIAKPSGRRAAASSRSCKDWYREAAHLIQQAADALCYAHGHGVLHRDVKPSNLLVDARGHIWVTDFGLAKADGSGDLTESGEIVGTLRYMAPERFQGWSDRRSDVYSLGLTLYEIISLEQAFDDTDRGRLVRKIIEEDPRPLRQIDPRVPEEIQTIVGKATEKEPARRYANMEEMAEDLRRFLADEPILARPPSTWERMAKWSRRHRPVVAAGATILALTLLGLAVSTALVSREQANTRRALEQVREKEFVGRQHLYAAEMNLAREAWEAGNISRVLELLKRNKPVPGEEDLRGFEWYLLSRLCHGSLATLQHGHEVNAVTFSPDGKTLASGGEDKVVYLWSLDTLAQRALLEGHSGAVSGLAFLSADRLASASSDGTMKLWDPLTGKEIATLGAPGGQGLQALSASRDGKLLATGRASAVYLWDVETRTSSPLTGHSADVSSVAFSMDGRILASGASDCTVKLWEVAGRREIVTLEGHPGPVLSVALSPDGALLASSSLDQTVVLWDLRTWRVVHRRDTHQPTHSVLFAPDGLQLLTGGTDCTLWFWKLPEMLERAGFRGHVDGIKMMALHPRGTVVATASGDRTVKVWDMAGDEEHQKVQAHYNIVTQLAVSPDGKRVASGSIDGSLKLWELPSGRLVSSFQDQLQNKNSVAFSPDGGRLVSGGDDRSVALHDAESLRQLVLRKDFANPVLAVCFLADGETVGVWLQGGSLLLWDTVQGNVTKLLEEEPGAAGSVAVFPDGRTLVLGTASGVLRIVDTASGTSRTLRDSKEDSIQCVLLLKGGKAAITGDGSAAKLWDLSVGRVTRTFAGHQLPVASVAVTPDGKRLATASWDKTLKLWDLGTGDELMTLKLDPIEPSSVVFSPDGLALLAGYYDGSIRIWRAEEPKSEDLEATLAKALAAPVMDPPVRAAASSSLLDGPLPGESGRKGIADLAAAVVSIGIKAFPRDEWGDGRNQSTFGGPSDDRREGRINVDSGDRYMYFLVTDGRLKASRRLSITGTFFDDPALASSPATLELRYTNCRAAGPDDSLNVFAKGPVEHVLSGTGAWVERTWRVEDAGFRSLMRSGCDFCICWSGSRVLIDRVEVVNDEPQGSDPLQQGGGPSIAVLDLGGTVCPRGLVPVDHPDGRNEYAVVGPADDRRTTLANRSGSLYLYFNVDDPAVKVSECLQIRATLYDDPAFRDAPAWVGLDYTNLEAAGPLDYPRAFLGHPDLLLLNGSGSWVEGTWEVADAGFRTLMQASADFRLCFGAANVSVDRIEVHILEPSRIHGVLDALRLAREGKLEEAEVALRGEAARLGEAAESSPGDAGLRWDAAHAKLLIAEILAERGLFEEADSALDGAVVALDAAKAASPSQEGPCYVRVRPDVCSARAWTSVKEPGKPAAEVSKALFLAREAVRLRPAYGRFLRNLGGAQLRAGHAGEAVKSLEASLRSWEDAGSFLLLALAHAVLGEEASAREAYERAAAGLREPLAADREILALEKEAAAALGGLRAAK